MRECCASRMEFFSQTATSESLALSQLVISECNSRDSYGKVYKGDLN